MNIFIGIMLLLLTAGSPDFKAVVAHFQTENITAIAGTFADELEVVTPIVDDILSKEEAKGILSAFFEAEEVKSFEIKHKGTSQNGNLYYGIGNLITSTGVYKVYLYFESGESDSTFELVELRIEEE